MLKPSKLVKMVQAAGVMKPAFLNTLCMALTMGTTSNLIAQKVCSPGQQPSINDFICTDPQLIAEATKITITKGTIRSVCSSLSGTFFGSWRDATGLNKPLLYIGLFTELITALVYSLSSWQWSSTTWLPAMFEAVVCGLFGMSVFQLGLSCYVSENTKPEELTLRLQMMHTMTSVGLLLATPLRGFLLTTFGFQNFYLIIAAINLLSLSQVRSSVHEKKKSIIKKDNLDMMGRFKAVFRPRPNNVVIWAMMIVKPLFFTFLTAEHTITLYFLQQGFQFTIKEETVYGTYCILIHTIGAVLTPLVCTKMLKLSDFRMGIVCCSMTTVAAIFTAFATTKTHLYLIALLGITKFNLFSIPQAILNKCIKNEELGVYTGFSSALGVFLPFGVNYFYSYTFSATSKTMPGAVYLISAVGYFILLCLFCIALVSYTPLEKKEDEKTTNADKKKED